MRVSQILPVIVAVVMRELRVQYEMTEVVQLDPSTYRAILYDLHSASSASFSWSPAEEAGMTEAQKVAFARNLLTVAAHSLTARIREQENRIQPNRRIPRDNEPLPFVERPPDERPPDEVIDVDFS